MALGQRVTFTGSFGDELSARLDLPAGEIHAFALIAHCFSCSKEQLATARLPTELAKRGSALLRLDFTRLGSPPAEFAHNNIPPHPPAPAKAASYPPHTLAAP